ncbi:MAG: 50S ribosomal protein L4, partial [Thioalkalivibrio sp.]
FSQKMNRKMYRAAMASILSELLRQDRLKIVEGFAVESGRTRDAVTALSGLGLESGLIVTAEHDASTWQALRNIPRIDIVTAAEINPVVLVGAETVVITTGAVKRIEEWLA